MKTKKTTKINRLRLKNACRRKGGKRPVHDCPASDYYLNSKERMPATEGQGTNEKSRDADRLYKYFFLNKLDSLRREMYQLDSELESRKMIHNQFVQELDSQILSASIFLDRIKHWGIGYKTGVDIERNFWERRIADLTKEKRNERLKLWKDSQDLKERSREMEREHKELLEKLGLLEE